MSTNTRITLGKKFHTDIDLLTEEESPKSAGTKIKIVLFFATIIIVEILIVGFLWFQGFSAQGKLDQLNSQIQNQTAAQGSFGKVASDVKTIKAKLTSYSDLSTKYAGLDAKIKKVSSLLPSNVSLLTFVVTTEGKVTITGTAATSDVAYQFYNLLSSDKTISNLSLNSITKAESDYKFSATFITTTK